MEEDQESFPYRPGDTVLITNHKELTVILDSFSPTHDCISPYSVEEVADQYATLVDLIRNPDPKLGLGTFAVLLLEDGQDIVLPLSAFRFMQIEVKEDVDEDEADKLAASKAIVSHMNRNSSAASNNNDLVQSIAAEYIQSAYRRYRACKNAIKERRKKSSDRLVLNLAAETITKNLKRVLSRGKSKLELEKLRDSRNNSIAASDVTLSVPNTERRNSKLLNDLMDAISPRPDISLPLPAVPAPHPNVSVSSKEGEVFILSNLSIKDVQVAAWNDDNRLYALLEYNLNNCLRRTETQSGSNKSHHISWSGNIMSVPVSASTNDKLHNGELLKVFIYHECLAIQDKLIGLLEIFLPSLYLNGKSNPNDAVIRNSQYVGDLYDSTNLVKRKRKGMISFDWIICKGKPSDSNYSPRLRDDASKVSKLSLLADQRLDAHSVQTKFVDVHDNEHDINGLSPSLVLAAANTLHSWENNEEADNPYYEEAKVYVPKPPTNKGMHNNLMKNHDQRHVEMKKIPSNKILPTNKSANDLQHSQVKPSYPLPGHKKGIAMSEEDLVTSSNAGDDILVDGKEPATSHNFQRPKLERGLSHSSTNTNNAYSVLTEKTKKSVSSTITNGTTLLREKDRENEDRTVINKLRKKTNKGGNSNKNGFKIEHDIQSIFDQAFYMGLLKVSASFTIRMKELIVLLDSLDIPVNPMYLMDSENCDEGSNNFKGSTRGRSTTAWLDECVQLPINHSTSFAATIADILEQRPHILATETSTNAMILSENKSVLAIKQLIHLIKGPYTAIRDAVFCACGSVSSDKGRLQSKTAKQQNQTLLPRRPRKLGSDNMQQILQAMKVIRCVNDGGDDEGSHQLMENAFQNIDGKDFLELPSKSLSSQHHITASVLQARFMAYQYTLQILDSAWDRGIRPHDPVNSEPKPSTSNSTATAVNNNTTDSSSQVVNTNRKEKTRMRKSISLTSEVKNRQAQEQDFEDFTEITVIHANTNGDSVTNYGNQVYNLLGTPQHISVVPSSSIQGSPTSSNGGTSSIGATSTIRRSNKDYFQIADANHLFQAYISHNRAYGWGFALASLTGLANSIGGFFGYRVDGSSLVGSSNPAGVASTHGAAVDNQSVISIPQTLMRENVSSAHMYNDMMWLMLDFPSEEVKSMTLNSLQSLLRPSLQHSTVVGSTPLSPSLVQIVSVVAMNTSSSGGSTMGANNRTTNVQSNPLGTTWGSFTSATLGGLGGTGVVQTELCVYIMKRCCTVANPSTSIHANRVGSAGSDLLFRRIKHLSIDEIKLGMEARVIPFSMLQRLCDRYEWFDKPSDDILHQFASKKVEIISLAELVSKQRVGVRLVKTNICDAIPIEALLPIAMSGLSAVDEEVADATNHRKKDSDGKWMNSDGNDNKDEKKKKSKKKSSLGVLNGKDKKKQSSKSTSQKKLKKNKRRADSDDDESDTVSSEGESLELENLSADDRKVQIPPKKEGKTKTLTVPPSYSRPKSAVVAKAPLIGGMYHLDEKTSPRVEKNNDQVKDFSWMKPIPALHTQLFKFDQDGMPHANESSSAMVVEDVVSPRAHSPLQMPVPDESPPVSGPPPQKLNVWEAVLDLNHAEYTQGVQIQGDPDSPNEYQRPKSRSGKATKPVNYRPSSAADQKNKNRNVQQEADPAFMGIAGAGFNATQGKWNDPAAVIFPSSENHPSVTVTPAISNKRPQSAASAIHQKRAASAATSAYTPYQDNVPNVILPSENDKTGVLGISLHIANAPRSEMRPNTTSPSSKSPSLKPDVALSQKLLPSPPADQNIKFGVNVTRTNGNRSPRGFEEQDRMFEEVTNKVDEIRNKPKSQQETLYYNREMARTEREAQRAEEVLRKELKRMQFDAKDLIPEIIQEGGASPVKKKGTSKR